MLSQSLAYLETRADQAMAYFYARLLLMSPEFGAMFPQSMAVQRKLFFAALTRLARAAPGDSALDDYLRQLGRDHRKYGVLDRHYPQFRDALLATLTAFGGHAWTPAARDAWEHALCHATGLMAEGAASDREPAWWLAEVIRHEIRCPGVAVITLRSQDAGPPAYLPGQHVSVQVPRRPRVWRQYSVANAPREDHTLDLHVRMVPGGMVSPVLVRETSVGDTVLLGAARGAMTAECATTPDVTCIAGGTGLAPLKAIVEGLINPAHRPQGRALRVIRLLFGARAERDLYDLPDLHVLEKACPSLAVIPVVSGDPHYSGLLGPVSEAAREHIPSGAGDVFVSGPDPMVAATLRMLAERAPNARVHVNAPAMAVPR